MNINNEDVNVLKRQYNVLMKKVNRISEALIKAEKSKCSLGMHKMMLESLRELISESKSWLLCKPLANAIVTNDIKTVDKKIQKQTNIINNTRLKANSCRQKVLDLKRTILTRQIPVVQSK